ncbi:hypothetical protein A3743_23910, partial [Oleiphilus sp. HI0072]
MLFSSQLQAAQTYNSETIDARNNSPIAMLFSLPRASFYPNEQIGSIHLQSDASLTNYISTTDKNGDYFRIDGETWRFRNTVSYQYSQQLRILVDASWIKHGGGLGDRFIFHFHDALALPQNGRSDKQHDRFNWTLYSENQQVLSFQREASSWGDTEVSFAWKMKEISDTQYNATLKIPTGNYTNQTGSEAFDINFSITQQNPEWFKRRNFFEQTKLSLWYGTGLGYIGKSEQLKILEQHPVNLSFRAGFAWLISPNWQLKSQIDTHSPLFKTELRELGWVPLQISFESAHRFSQDISINLMIAEDIRPRSVPDVI